MFRLLDPQDVGIAIRSIPWRFVEPLRESCLRAHSQTLERLNERGGLGIEELYNHVKEMPWSTTAPPKEELKAWFEKWLKENGT